LGTVQLNPCVVANQIFAKVKNYIFAEIIKSGFTLSFKNLTEALQYSFILLFLPFYSRIGYMPIKTNVRAS